MTLPRYRGTACAARRAGDAQRRGLACARHDHPVHPAGPGGGTHPACWPYCVPIDKGLVFLIIAAGLYGGKKLYDYQKELKAKA